MKPGACQHWKFLGNYWILHEQLIDLKEFFKAVLTSMHSLILTIVMKGIFFQTYDKTKTKTFK